MKGTETFKETIKAFLDTRAMVDELFREKYATTTRTIDDICNYIVNEVAKSGRCGFCDDEIFSMAIHIIEEPDIEINKAMDCHIVSNHSIELSEEEKAEQRALALRRFQEQELIKLQTRNSRQGSTAKTTKNIQQPTLSLFD